MLVYAVIEEYVVYPLDVVVVLVDCVGIVDFCTQIPMSSLQYLLKTPKFPPITTKTALIRLSSFQKYREFGQSVLCRFFVGF